MYFCLYFQCVTWLLICLSLIRFIGKWKIYPFCFQFGFEFPLCMPMKGALLNMWAISLFIFHLKSSMKYITLKIVSLYILYLCLNCQLHYKFNFEALLYFFRRKVYHTTVVFLIAKCVEDQLSFSFNHLRVLSHLPSYGVWASPYRAVRVRYYFYSSISVFYLYITISLSWIFTCVTLKFALVLNFKLNIVGWVFFEFSSLCVVSPTSLPMEWLSSLRGLRGSSVLCWGDPSSVQLCWCRTDSSRRAWVELSLCGVLPFSVCDLGFCVWKSLHFVPSNFQLLLVPSRTVH